VLFVSPPFCTGYAYHACRRARAKFPARAGLALAVLELLTLIALLVIGFLAEDNG
jgi:hypothetical protein